MGKVGHKMAGKIIKTDGGSCAMFVDDALDSPILWSIHG
eukprot:SAG11_NODE_1583_length_4644_cov_4.084708_4_plen_39_part_00